MKKRICSWLCALAMAITVIPAVGAAEDTTDRGTLYYEEIIAPQYDDIRHFSDGLAAVKKNGKWGYIDTENQVVVPFQYDMAYSFNEGHAIVYKKAASGYEDEYYVELEPFIVDTKGNVTSIKSEYPLTMFAESTELVGTSSEKSFYNGYVCLPCEGENFLVDTNGNIKSTDLSPIHVPTDGYMPGYMPGLQYGAGIMDDEGNLLVSFDSAISQSENSESYIGDIRPFNQGLAPATLVVDAWDDEYYTSNYSWGFMNPKGQWVIQPQFEDFIVSDMYGSYRVFDALGRACVKKDGKWGAINKQGQTIVPFEYDWLMPESEGLMAFQKNGKAGFLDAETLKVAIEGNYLQTSSFSNGLAAAVTGDSGVIIDRKGNPVEGSGDMAADTFFYENEQGSITYLAPSEYLPISKNGKYGFAHLEYTPELPTPDEMSDWAYEQVTAAIEKDMIPQELQNLYRMKIIRTDFADTIIQSMEVIAGKDIETLIKEKTGKTADELASSYPFVDTTSSNVIYANALGIISGYGDGTFLPYNNISRQEAASMLMRAAKVLGADTTSLPDAGFADSNNIATWAADGVNYVYQAGVMSGVGDNQFDPTGNYTREQTFVTVYRLLLALTEA